MNHIHSRRLSHCFSLIVLLSSLCPSCLCGESSSLDPELDKPYRLTVVLDVGRHRIFTDVFRQRLGRELRDSLQASFGDLVQVEVTEDHPKLAEIRKTGLKDTLDRWAELTGVKTHFVRVDYAAGQYEIEARQHDGLTGLASPGVRRQRTPDPQFVARLAALLVDRDFGPVATLRPSADGKAVTVEFKGGKLGVALDRWVERGDVLAVVPVVAGETQARKLEDLLLRVEKSPDKSGACDCRLFERYEDSLKKANAAGFRCLKLSTVSAPLRLKLVQRGAGSSNTPAANMQVEVRRAGFDEKEKAAASGRTGNDGFFSTDATAGGAFDRIAFVTVRTEPRASLIPIAVVDDSPVSLKVQVRPLDPKALLTARKELWEQDVYEGGLMQRALFRQLQELGADPDQREAALKRAEDGLKRSNDAWLRFITEKEVLNREAERLKVKLEYDFGEQCLQDVSKGHTELRAYIDQQKQVIAEENDPKRKEALALINQGKIDEREAEFDKALAAYDRALELHKDDKTTQHRDQLRERWKVKSPEHQQARTWIYKTWPEADPVKEPKVLAEAKAMFEVCEKAGDPLTVQKFLQEAIEHAGKLKKQHDALETDVNEGDRKQAVVLADVGNQLKPLIAAAQAYLQKAGGKAP